MTEKPRRYLAVVQLNKNSPQKREAADVPALMGLFDRFSNGEKELAFKSYDGQIFGVFFRSNLPGPMMRSQFEESAATQNGDSLLVFEAGQIAAGTSGFSRAWTWLQHH
jgi:hypothetical protein